MTDTTDSKLAHSSGLRAVQDTNVHAALGRAVSYLMKMPSFGNLKFSHWSRILVGQINRRHYLLVMDGDRTVGFVGWAFVDEAKARAWVEDQSNINERDCSHGDCIIINAWAADNDRVNRFILERLREIARDKKRVYAKRYYDDGTFRPKVLSVNKFVEAHIEKLLK